MSLLLSITRLRSPPTTDRRPVNFSHVDLSVRVLDRKEDIGIPKSNWFDTQKKKKNSQPIYFIRFGKSSFHNIPHSSYDPYFGSRHPRFQFLSYYLHSPWPFLSLFLDSVSYYLMRVSDCPSPIALRWMIEIKWLIHYHHHKLLGLSASVC